MKNLVALFMLAAAPNAWAAADPYVPPDLEPWRAWVLEEHREIQCPHSEALGFTCQWPGELEVSVSEEGGEFKQTWRLFAPGWVTLPGDPESWPLEVSVNGESAPVAQRGNQPALYLQPGEYTIAGHFDWERPPERLLVPAESGLVRLSRDGEAMAHPRWEGERLWLGREQAAEAREADSLELRVHRKLADGVPQTLETAIRVSVSGRAREEALGPALLSGFEPLSVNSELPVRLDDQGVLHAQVRPGSWSIRLDARATETVEAIGPPQAGAPWPDTETWSYAADDFIRVTSVEAANPIDPQQTTMPGEWRQLPAYRLAGGETLHIVEHSRGMDPKRGNRLELGRDMWLGFDGDRWIVADMLGGEMVRGWRLGMEEPYRLTQLKEAGEPRLLSRLEAGGPVGAEVRRHSVQVSAVSEVRAGLGAIPASGWTQDLDRMNATVNLPPGFRMFAVSGFDQSRGDWLSRWGLMTIFLVVIVAVAVGRLYGWTWGAVAALGLVLTVHEADAPRWLWLNAVLALALAGVLKAGALKRMVSIYAGLALLGILVAWVPFALQQARVALYPQVAGGGHAFMDGWQAKDRIQSAYDQAPKSRPRPAEMPATAEEQGQVAALQRSEVTGSRVGKQDLVQAYAPGALIQAGVAAPDWQWDRVSLSLSGPVRAEQSARFWIMPPWLTGLWRFLGIGLTGALLGWLGLRLFRLGRKQAGKTGKMATAGLVLLLGLLPLAGAAQTPDPAILKELEQRLTRPPECAPACAQVQSADIRTTPDGLGIRLSVHAQDETAVALPGTRGGWTPASVTVNGATGSWLLRRDDRLWLPLPGAGRFTVTLHGPAPDANAFNLDFPERPKRVVVSGGGWEASGVREGRLVSDSLRFVRLAGEDGGAAPAAEGDSLSVPPFVIVDREVLFDVQWQVVTRVERRAPREGGFTVHVPLLDGESVLSQESWLQVTDGEARLTFGPGQDALTFSSRLPMKSPLTLDAAEAGHYRERWRFVASHIWHADLVGLPPAVTVGPGEGGYSPVYYPRPGETLAVTLNRPEAVPGDTLAFDSVALDSQVGLRGRESTLNLTYRATQGGSHEIGLPAGVTLRRVTVDGQSVGVAPVDGRLPLSVTPGTHAVEIAWEQPTDGLSSVATPRPDLRARAANIRLNLELPRDRWVLWASGPRLGPVVMYWSELALILVVAFILGRYRRLPVKPYQWVLLSLGLSLTLWPVILVLFAWLAVLDWRARRVETFNWMQFDLVQLGLYIVSFVALGALLAAIPLGLLSNPDMGIVGQSSSSSSLHWYADYSDGKLPSGSAFSLPIWCYKAFILAWSVWLSLALIGWLKWAWGCLSEGGLWRRKPKLQTRKDGQGES